MAAPLHLHAACAYLKTAGRGAGGKGLMMRIVFIGLSLAALAACGEGSAFDNSFREAYVRKGVDTCVEAAGRGGNAPPGVDFRSLCTCMVERHIDGKSAIELMQETEAQAGPAAEREMEQCVNEATARGELPSANPGAGGSKPPL